jgi:hypothetical protein
VAELVVGDAALAGPAVDDGLGDVEGGREAGGVEEVRAGGLQGRLGLGGGPGSDEAEDVAPAMQLETSQPPDDGSMGGDEGRGVDRLTGEKGDGLVGGDRGVRREGPAQM